MEIKRRTNDNTTLHNDILISIHKGLSKERIANELNIPEWMVVEVLQKEYGRSKRYVNR